MSSILILSQAYICPFRESQAVACGTMPRVIDPLQDLPALRSALSEAKKSGTVGLVVQMLQSKSPASVLPSQRWLAIASACRDINLPIVVDEALTALRCGAPFCHQRPEYALVKPDLVVFGKGLRVSGIAVNFDGQFLQSLAITPELQRMRAIFRWHDLQTRGVSIPILIEALAVLEAAIDQDWPARSKLVGAAVRGMIWNHEQQTGQSGHMGPIVGLDAVIYIEKARLRGLPLQGIPEGDFVRLLPVLDDWNLSEQSLSEHLVGTNSRAARGRLSEWLLQSQCAPLWCYVCGDPTEELLEEPVEWCKVCCLAMCGEQACRDAFRSHPCLRTIA
jgi:hypothetical protein